MSVRGLAKAAAAKLKRELGAGSGQRRILEMRMSEFATSDLVQEVKSGVLSEHILWVADNAEVPAGNTLVVYRADECRLDRLHVLQGGGSKYGANLLIIKRLKLTQLVGLLPSGQIRCQSDVNSMIYQSLTSLSSLSLRVCKG